jgi:DNA-binding MarR family transcriptional regulator
VSELGQAGYERLLEFRTALRRFERWSEDCARDAGLTPAQHQLLLAIAGHPGTDGPTISDVAEYLLVRHHSAVGLVDRTAQAGLLRRTKDPQDARVVRLQVTESGARRLARLSTVHLAELRRLAPMLQHLADITQDEAVGVNAPTRPATGA